jgi:predicted DNA-binding protein
MAKETGKRTNQKAGRMVPAGKEVQVFTRLSKKDAERLRKAAKADERPVMAYVRRLIVKHLDELKKG